MTRVDLRQRTNYNLRKIEWMKETARVDTREKVKGELEIEERLRSVETEA